MIEIRDLKKEDRKEIKKILENCKIFTEKEIVVALELIDLNLSGSSDYIINVLCDGTKIVGFVCYGENSIANGVWELYWICVEPDFHGKGYGSILLKRVEEIVKRRGGRSIFIETSSLQSYDRARRFYEKFGYEIVCLIKDYYKIGDHKIIYRKDLY